LWEWMYSFTHSLTSALDGGEIKLDSRNRQLAFLCFVCYIIHIHTYARTHTHTHTHVM